MFTVWVISKCVVWISSSQLRVIFYMHNYCPTPTVNFYQCLDIFLFLTTVRGAASIWRPAMLPASYSMAVTIKNHRAQNVNSAWTEKPFSRYFLLGFIHLTHIYLMSVIYQVFCYDRRERT